MKYQCPHCQGICEFEGQPYLWCPSCYGYYNPDEVDIALRPVTDTESILERG
jgi:hypothetical protein